MAALKKSIKRKDGGKPSTVLIIFLVFFILVSIGLGVFAYYGYEGQDNLKKIATDAKKGAAASKIVDDYRMGVIRLLATAMGADVDEDDKQRATTALAEIVKNDKGKYGADATLKDRVVFATLFAELEKELAFDGNENKFKENFRTKYKQTLDQLKNTESQLGKLRKELTDARDEYGKYQKKHEEYWTTAIGLINKGNANTLAQSKQTYEAIEVLRKQNQEIQDQKLKLDADLKDVQDKLKIEEDRVKMILEKKGNAAVEVVTSKKNGDQHALLLDMSRGIPFWDRPVGKVTRVDIDARQVFINIGSELGVRPELTFVIFGDNGKGLADKYMKGSIEVIRVVDGQTSLCRITSLYDADGAEIALNDPIRGGRAAREVDAALQQGDLLFNMFWNSHIAFAGALNVGAFTLDAPAEQMRHIAGFVGLLERMGIYTDAYLDLTDGQMKGALSSKTRFLVLGDRVEPKNPNDEAQKERAKLINDGIAAMKKDAIERGMFLISAENFTIAAGYRKARNANDTELAKFRASVPFAGGTASGGLVIQRDPGAAPVPMPIEKKENEKKDPEGKEKKDPEAK